MKKKILLLVMVPALCGLTTTLKAQCDLQFSNLVIQPVSVTSVGTKCHVVFNASFDITTNSGFKYLFFHSWLAPDYPNPPIFNCSQSNAQDPGTALQLGTVVDQPGKSFLDIGFINLNTITFPTGVPVNVTANFATLYPEDNTVVLTQPSNSPGLSAIITRTSANVLHFDVDSILVILNQACGSPILVKTDIWGSNSNAPKPKAQCYICGIVQNFGDPDVSGFKLCTNPRQYTLGITTTDPVPRTITYKIYVDLDSSGTLNAGDDLAFTSGPITISSSSSFSTGGPVSLPAPYSTSQPWSNKGYLVLVEGTTLPNSIVELLPDPACSPLPVKFHSFTVRRTSASQVLLHWQTATEINNSGFEVQRFISGGWETVTFIASQAPGGNSDALLSYSYTDVNTAKGITQYRIRQVDLDGRSSYSEIRMVRGDGQTGKTIVYPNPTADGRVNVVFDDVNTTRDVLVSDMSGRVVWSRYSVSNNNVQIDNLPSGIYMLKIYVPATGEFTTEKIVVQNR
jgi:hypothetical protein